MKEWTENLDDCLNSSVLLANAFFSGYHSKQIPKTGDWSYIYSNKENRSGLTGVLERQWSYVR